MKAKPEEFQELAGAALELAKKQAKSLIKKGLKQEDAFRIAAVTGQRFKKQHGVR